MLASSRTPRPAINAALGRNPSRTAVGADSIAARRAENTPSGQGKPPRGPREQGRTAGRSEEDELTTNGNLHGIFCHKLCRIVPFRVIYSKNISVLAGTADIDVKLGLFADFPLYVPVSAEIG